MVLAVVSWAGVEEEDAVVQELELRERVAVPVGADELGEHLAGIAGERVALALADQPAQVGLELLDRLASGGALRVGEAGLEAAENGHRPRRQPVAVCARHAEHVADELDRKLHREIVQEIEAPHPGDLVERARDDLLDPRPERAERPRRERRGEALAHPGVARRIVEDEAGGVVLVERGVAHGARKIHRLVGREQPGIPVDRVEIGVAGQEPGPVRQRLQRRVAAERVEHRVGILVEIPVEAADVEGGRRFRPGLRDAVIARAGVDRVHGAILSAVPARGKPARPQPRLTRRGGWRILRPRAGRRPTFPPGDSEMPRIGYIEEQEKTEDIREMIASAERTGAPDPRVVSIMARHPTAGLGWIGYWNALLYEGLLPHVMKEMCRIFISMAHECGYCSTVRSKVAQEQGTDRGQGPRAPRVRDQRAVRRPRARRAPLRQALQAGRARDRQRRRL